MIKYLVVWKQCVTFSTKEVVIPNSQECQDHRYLKIQKCLQQELNFLIFFFLMFPQKLTVLNCLTC